MLDYDVCVISRYVISLTRSRAPCRPYSVGCYTLTTTAPPLPLIVYKSWAAIVVSYRNTLFTLATLISSRRGEVDVRNRISINRSLYRIYSTSETSPLVVVCYTAVMLPTMRYRIRYFIAPNNSVP